MATASASSPQGLERNAIGLTEVLFQSITHMAPAVATALSLGAATLFAGGNTPLAVVLALIAALFTAYSIGELARYLPSAGGMYTYVARGLGSFAGWLMAWAFLLAEPVVPAALFASFGLFGASLITTMTGFSNDYLWLPLAVLCGLDRLVARLPRHLDLDACGCRPRPDRDRDLRRRFAAADHQRRLEEHAVGLRTGRGRAQAGPPGNGVLPARVRRASRRPPRSRRRPATRSGRSAGRSCCRPS